jgi:type 1 fimbriae regulatory protein FimB/type 1 fimbriae regulatory protein FimE
VERRPREYLTPAEVETLCKTARTRGRYGHRDATMILIAYRHGLRVGELCALTWDQVDFGQGLLHVTRLKHGVPSVHPLGGDELRSLRRLRRERETDLRLFRSHWEWHATA